MSDKDKKDLTTEEIKAAEALLDKEDRAAAARQVVLDRKAKEQEDADKAEAEAAAKAAAPVAKAFAAVMKEFGFKPQTAPQPGAQPQVNKETTILTTKLSTNAKYGIGILVLLVVVMIVGGLILFSNGNKSSSAPVAKAPTYAPAPAPAGNPPSSNVKPDSDVPKKPAGPAAEAPKVLYKNLDIRVINGTKEFYNRFFGPDGNYDMTGHFVFSIYDDQGRDNVSVGQGFDVNGLETSKAYLVDAYVGMEGSTVQGWLSDFGNYPQIVINGVRNSTSEAFVVKRIDWKGELSRKIGFVLNPDATISPIGK